MEHYCHPAIALPSTSLYKVLSGGILQGEYQI